MVLLIYFSVRTLRPAPLSSPVARIHTQLPTSHVHPTKLEQIAVTMIDSKKLKEVLDKATSINSQPTEETFPELPTVLIWFRFILAALYGSYLGVNGVRSGTMVMHSINLIAFVPLMYCRLYLGVKEEAFGMKIIFSGLLNAMALSLLLWIYFFTAQHEGDEDRLAAMLVSKSIEGDILSEAIPLVEEITSEF